MAGLSYPFPSSQTGKYSGFTQVATGRVPLDSQGNAFTSGLEEVCADNCDADFTCKGFATWTQNGKVWCLKSSSTPPNPWLAIPEYIANKTQSKIFSKN